MRSWPGTTAKAYSPVTSAPPRVTLICEISSVAWLSPASVLEACTAEAGTLSVSPLFTSPTRV